MELKQTPLFNECKSIGSKMVSFAGWEMPIQFSSLIEEHEAVRKNAGIFDISHMGMVLLEGENPKKDIQKLVPSDLFRIGPGEACYTVLLNNNGGIIDDLIIYDLGRTKKRDSRIVLVINAACTDSDIAWLRLNLSQTTKISDFKSNGALIALQGPKSIDLLENYVEESLTAIPRYGHKLIKFRNSQEKFFIGRTGYTGEEGFECLLPAMNARLLWKNLIKRGVKPCGLGARDTLRLEAGMHLYGNDINANTTPFEAGLGWLVHLEMQSNFIGRTALERQATTGIKNKLAGFVIDGRAIARKGNKIIHKQKYVGEITSGSWSPSLKKGIGLAYLPTELTKIDTPLKFEIRGKEFCGKVVRKPFYRRNY